MSIRPEGRVGLWDAFLAQRRGSAMGMSRGEFERLMARRSNREAKHEAKGQAKHEAKREAQSQAKPQARGQATADASAYPSACATADAPPPPARRPWMARARPEDRTEDGIVFASRAELRRYRELRLARLAGEVAWFVRQPLFDLGGVRYRADFLVVRRDGRVEVEEVKPPRAPEEVLRRWRRNAEQVRTLYGVDVKLIQA